MTGKDIDDLFELLKLYFPNSPKTRDKTLKKAWLLILEPFERSDVRTALLDVLRVNEYFPDPQKIAVHCPPPRKAELRQNAIDAEAVEASSQLYQEWAGLVDKRRSAGVPATASEAKAQGISDGQWLDLLESCGLQFAAEWGK